LLPGLPLGLRYWLRLRLRSWLTGQPLAGRLQRDGITLFVLRALAARPARSSPAVLAACAAAAALARPARRALDRRIQGHLPFLQAGHPAHDALLPVTSRFLAHLRAISCSAAHSLKVR
jgi:hypothetical protein